MDTKQVRKELKNQLGYNSRQVSVRQRYCGYSSSVTFTVRDESVDFNAVEKFANSYKSVDRCQYSGEILMGGNTYIDVEFSDDLQTKFDNAYKNELLENFKAIESGETHDDSFEFNGYRVKYFKSDNMLHVFKITTEMIAESVFKLNVFRDSDLVQEWLSERLSSKIYKLVNLKIQG